MPAVPGLDVVVSILPKPEVAATSHADAPYSALALLSSGDEGRRVLQALVASNDANDALRAALAALTPYDIKQLQYSDKAREGEIEGTVVVGVPMVLATAAVFTVVVNHARLDIPLLYALGPVAATALAVPLILFARRDVQATRKINALLEALDGVVEAWNHVKAEVNGLVRPDLFDTDDRIAQLQRVTLDYPHLTREFAGLPPLPLSSKGPVADSLALGISL